MQKVEEAEDYTESDDEGADGYRKGGYHPVAVGEVYKGRYQVVAKLGWGHFSTVWLCQDLSNHTFVAMKCQKSAPHYTEAAYDEIELLAEAAKRGTHAEWQAMQQGSLKAMFPTTPFTGVVTLIDYFEHCGPHGKHVCMVFEVMGPNVLALIKRYNFKGIPLDIVRKVSTHTLIGLDYLHRICGIIHTDLKPENVLVGCPRGVPVNKQGMPLVGHVEANPEQTMMMLQGEEVKNELQTQKGSVLNDSREANDEALKKVQQVITQPSGFVSAAAQAAATAAADAAAECTAKDEAAAQKGICLKGPPFMRPFLKPSRSDPTLLSSYGDDMVLLSKPLYNHAKAEERPCKESAAMAVPRAASDRQSQAAAHAAEAAAAAAKAGHLPERTAFIDQKVLDDVVQLDLFDHPGVAYKVADLGNACWTERHFSDDIQTRQYRSPETIINASYDTSADVWSLACMIFELVTGDYLFDPKASEEYPRDEDHLALFIELLGPMPPALVARGRRSSTYFNRRCELRHIKSLRYWGLSEVLQQKYHMHPVEARNFASFLLPMLKLMPEERVSARAALEHPWLLGLPAPEVTEFVARHELAVGNLSDPGLRNGLPRGERWDRGDRGDRGDRAPDRRTGEDNGERE